MNSSYLRGAAGAPAKIREALGCDSSNQWSELGVDVGAAGAFRDAGDLRLNNSLERINEDLAEIEGGVGSLLDHNQFPISLGGDHSITYPMLKAFAPRYRELTSGAQPAIDAGDHQENENRYADGRQSAKPQSSEWSPPSQDYR